MYIAQINTELGVNNTKAYLCNYYGPYHIMIEKTQVFKSSFLFKNRLRLLSSLSFLGVSDLTFT